MKIHQLLGGGPTIAITNEEQHFIESHEGEVKLSSLDDHNQWLAQSLVRKGVYKIKEDNNTLERNINEKYS